MLLFGVVVQAHGRGEFLHGVDSGRDGGCMRGMYWCGRHFFVLGFCDGRDNIVRMLSGKVNNTI
jgi:hypothetical protein